MNQIVLVQDKCTRCGDEVPTTLCEVCRRYLCSNCKSSHRKKSGTIWETCT